MYFGEERNVDALRIVVSLLIGICIGIPGDHYGLLLYWWYTAVPFNARCNTNMYYKQYYLSSHGGVPSSLGIRTLHQI